jgi:hypothetical protein
MKTKTMDIIFFHISCVSDATDESESQEHNELVDDKYLQVLIQLRNMDLLFKKKNIQRYRLVAELCNWSHVHFAVKRFRFLVEWDPSALYNQPDRFGDLPICHAPGYSSIQEFRMRRYSCTLFRYTNIKH